MIPHVSGITDRVCALGKPYRKEDVGCGSESRDHVCRFQESCGVHRSLTQNNKTGYC